MAASFNAPVSPIDPYRRNTNPFDGVNDREALAHAERYAVVAEEAFASGLYPKATAASTIAQAFAAITIAARTGATS